MMLFGFLRFCWRIYRSGSGVHYYALTRFGVPVFTVIVGRDRDAWVITHLAIEHQLTSGAFK